MGDRRQKHREANEIMYKMAEFLLQKMFNYGLIDAEEKGKIRTCFVVQYLRLHAPNTGAWA